MPNPRTAAQTDLDVPNETTVHEVHSNVLPIHCPMPGSSLWNSHPRVYIPVEETGEASCPYCGCKYVLKDE